MLSLPIDVLSFIIDKSEIIKASLCINCFRNFGLNYNCNHYNHFELQNILKFRLVCKHWNKTILHFLKNNSVITTQIARKFDYSHATVHLIELYEYSDSDIDSDHDSDKFYIQFTLSYTIDFLMKKFPYLIGRLRHGDIIENTPESGYRSQGIIMYYNNGVVEKLIGQNKKYDDYGSPSIEFELFDFPGGYWDKKYCDKNHKLNTNFNTNYLSTTQISPISPISPPTPISEFYWHADHGLAIIYQNSLNNATPLGKKGNRHWWIVKKNGRNYLVSKNVKKQLDKYKATYAYCDGWSDDHQAYIIDTLS